MHSARESRKPDAFGPRRLVCLALLLAATGCSEASTGPEPVLNRAPVASAVAFAAAASADGPTALVPETMAVGDTAVAAVAGLFSDPDGDVLTYTATNSQPRVLHVSMRHDTLTVAALERGSATIAVKATDPGGSSASVRFAVKVVGVVQGLTTGLPEHPFENLTIDHRTVGTLRLGLDPDAFPVIVREDEPGVLVAASQLGSGRVVALSGADFLSHDEPTLLGSDSFNRFLANAVRWTHSDTTAIRVLADNSRIAEALASDGLDSVGVVGRGPGWWDADWRASALRDVDVAVVLVNRRCHLRLVPSHVAPLRRFVESGGGLVIAGSALYWRWCFEDYGPFAGNVLLGSAGIGWNEDAIDEIASATVDVDPRLTGSAVWQAYLAGDRIGPDRMWLLPDLFSEIHDLGRTVELDSALVRLVRETPELPILSSVAEARLAAVVAETLGPHEWPETHQWAAVFPGLPAQDARLVDGTVSVDASRSEFPADASRRESHFPLGFYAPPGALVTIELPVEHATGELWVAVGQQHDDLRQGYAAQPLWRRAPRLIREFDVRDRRTHVTNAYGGSIALVVPADYERGSVQVTVRGAIPMAVYTDGESNAAEWHAALDGGAPQAIIQKMGGIRLVISTENARAVDDPGEVSAFWDGFQRHHAELSGEPVPRAFESIWIFDPQVGHGYANASPLRINYPLDREGWALLPGTVEGRAKIASLPGSPKSHGQEWWLFGHELGHQWQTQDWTGHGITEVGVNLFTMYTLNYYILGGGEYTMKNDHPRAPNSVDHAALANLRWPTADVFERLSMYRQIIAEFGWRPMEAVFHSYYDPAYPRATYSGSLDGFAIRFSAIVKRDLVAFFRRWEYPLSDSAAVTIRSFGLEAWLPPGW